MALRQWLQDYGLRGAWEWWAKQGRQWAGSGKSSMICIGIFHLCIAHERTNKGETVFVDGKIDDGFVDWFVVYPTNAVIDSHNSCA